MIEELADDAVEHRAPPDHRLVLADQQPHRHHGNATAVDRGQPLIGPFALHLGGAVGHPQHGGGVGAIDIGIEQAHPQARLGQGAGQVHGHRALAHAALAAADGDHLLHPRNRLALGAAAVAAAANRRPLVGMAAGAGLGRGLGQFNLDVVDAIEAEQGRPGLTDNPFPLAGGKARQGQAKHGPIRLQAHLVDPLQLHQGATAAGVLEGR